jgi:UDP-N-acetylmuramoyl-tripeptide--D-alanyl-D-alanine ligase
MGTYGPGEIAEMVAWCPPAIGIITAIGPVHLERMKDEETIARAKEEILSAAHTAILNVDNQWLRPVAERAAAAGKKVVRCSATDRSADVAVIDGVVLVGGEQLARIDDLEAAPTNVACAVAAALELGVPADDVAARVTSLPPTENRQTVSRSADRGFTIIDDTFNSNPAGARAALALLARRAADGGSQVLVTPGMVELGSRQADENRDLAALAAEQCDTIVVVGHTNRKALVEGARRGGATLVTVETRPEAVEWVRSHLHDGDAVLYENDLPDHFP